ncbi:MAG: helix-turn-helix domain-containing protein [Mycobacteriales bacterium]
MVKDDLDQLLDELSGADPDLAGRVDAALARRELARELAEHRRKAGLTQVQIAARMGTSQAQITRFESGADTRVSTVARYAAALGLAVSWQLSPLTAASAVRGRHQVRAKPA